MGGRAFSDGVFLDELIRDLRGVKLDTRDREFVLSCHQQYKRDGVVSRDAESRLRRLYDRKKRLVTQLQEARERARVSMAMEKRDLSKSALEKAKTARREEKKRQREDLGI